MQYHKNLNPIPYGISVPAVLRGGGMESTPPAKNTLRGVRFQFFKYIPVNLYPTSQNPKKNQKKFKIGKKSNLKKKCTFCTSKESGYYLSIIYIPEIRISEPKNV